MANEILRPDVSESVHSNINNKKMSSTEKFCLRWNDFESNISEAFRELREEKDFFNVTLACDDDQLQAHKVILSACSPFFRNIFRRNKHEHPLLYLKGVNYTNLVSVLNFMYHGEVNVAQEELNSFLAVAEDLKVKGLTQSNSTDNRPPTSSSKPKNDDYQRKTETFTRPSKHPQPQVKPSSAQSTPYPHHDDVQELVPVKSEPVVHDIPDTQTITPYNQYSAYQEQGEDRVVADPGIEYGVEEYGDYGQYSEDNYSAGTGLAQEHDENKGLDDLIAQSMKTVVDELGNRMWKCEVCNRINKDKTNTSKHVETHFQGFAHHCPLCGKQSKSREAMRKHMSYYHKR